MIQFTEAIRLFNGQLQHLELHQQRMNRTTEHFYNTDIDLSSIVDRIPYNAIVGLYKCRVVYDNEIRDVQWQPYIPKPRNRVQLVDARAINYQYKYLNRTMFEQLANRYPVDDLILIKNGTVTDALYSNLVFENNSGLFTPDTPLLLGTRRQYLLNGNVIQLAHITPQNLHQYRWVHFINAMLNLGDIPPVSVNNIFLASY